MHKILCIYNIWCRIYFLYKNKHWLFLIVVWSCFILIFLSSDCDIVVLTCYKNDKINIVNHHLYVTFEPWTLLDTNVIYLCYLYKSKAILYVRAVWRGYIVLAGQLKSSHLEITKIYYGQFQKIWSDIINFSSIMVKNLNFCRTLFTERRKEFYFLFFIFVKWRNCHFFANFRKVSFQKFAIWSYIWQPHNFHNYILDGFCVSVKSST